MCARDGGFRFDERRDRDRGLTHVDPALTTYIARRVAVLAELRRLLIEKLGVKRSPDEIDPDTPLFGSGLGLDSVDAVELLVHLEDVFQVRLPNSIGGRAEMRTVNTVVDLIMAREAKASGGA